MLNQNNVTLEQLNLWQKIQAFKFDAPGIKFRFSDRLARENAWTKSYALRVMEEYKKFVFLSAISLKPLTPSDPVDQVWHLHLTYTQSYWKGLCQDILQKEFHHNPTQGGEAEQQKFNGFYDFTFQQYTHYFEQNPPPDIWQDAETRFSAINFVRVNKDKKLILEKPNNLPALVFMSVVGLTAISTLVWISYYFLVIIPVFGLIGFGIAKVATSEAPAYGGKVNHSNNDSVSVGDSGCSSGHSGCSGCSGCSGSGCSGCSGCGS